jgi:hypothetical protein
MVMDILADQVNTYIYSKYFLTKLSSFCILGQLHMLERMSGIDINGDGYIGRRPDVVPGFPAVYGYPSMVYGPGGQIYPTNSYVGPQHHQHRSYF